MYTNGKEAEGQAEKGKGKGQEMISGLPRLNLLRQLPSPEALLLIPEAVARRYQAIPLVLTGETLQVAMAKIEDILAIQDLAAISRKRIEPVAASTADIAEAIDFNYKTVGELGKQLDSLTISSEAPPEQMTVEVSEDAPVSRVLKLIIEEGVKSRASDIHIEPESDILRVRYRIDGTLHDILSLPSGVHLPLLSRVKILAGMNIADHRRPQDGQISMEALGKSIDIRVATADTVNGEMTVLRILDKSLAVLSLSQLGFLPESQDKYEQMLLNPFGMILISGPTGAGKTTTLYASLNSLDRVGRNIITIEDPVEYRFKGINQLQVNVKAGLTFASGLRSILRLDPDIVLVGEIRDRDTAQIAVQAALTGHLVLSSIHANDSVGVLSRLVDLGVEPFLVCTAVVGIVAQRMVRRVCQQCDVRTTVSSVEQMAYFKEMGEKRKDFRYGAGCKSCAYTGYLGRTGIFEILQMTDEIRQLVMSGASASVLRAQAFKEGMASIARDAMLKARVGITTPSEVIRHVHSIE